MKIEVDVPNCSMFSNGMKVDIEAIERIMQQFEVNREQALFIYIEVERQKFLAVDKCLDYLRSGPILLHSSDFYNKIRKMESDNVKKYRGVNKLVENNG